MLNHPSTETLYFLTQSSNKLLFFFFCSFCKMTTTYFTRQIGSEGIVTYATLPRKITFRLSIQILIQNKCLPICRHSPIRCFLLKPTGWLSFVSVFQSFSTHLGLTQLWTYSCAFTEPISHPNSQNPMLIVELSRYKKPTSWPIFIGFKLLHLNSISCFLTLLRSFA